MGGRFNASHLQLSPPRNPEGFEDLCLDLFRAIWKDPYAKKNGRRGQGQDGVDIYGSNIPGEGISGIQCKNKDLQLNSNLTSDIVDKEVSAAKEFKPPLARFIIVTVDPKDAKLEEHVRLISDKHAKAGKFLVEIMFWDDLVSHLGDYPEVADKHLGTTWDQSKAQDTSPDSVRQTDKDAIISNAQGDVQIAHGDGNIQITNKGANASITVQPGADINSEYQEEVNHARDLLEEHRYSEALEYLTSLKERIWATANDYIKFRVLTNTASAQSSLQMHSEAAANYLEAYELQPENTLARNNRAFAHLLTDNYEEAIKQADDVLKKDPKNIQAISIKIQAMSWLKKSYEEISKALKKSPTDSHEVQYSLAFAAQKLKKNDEALKRFKAAKAGDKNNPHVMAGLAICMLAAITEGDRPAMHGMLNQDQRQQVDESIELLEEAWGLISNTRDKKHYTEWLYNLSLAYRLIDNKAKAKEASDKLLQLKPGEGLYIKNASLIALESGEYAEAESHLNALVKSGSKMPEITLMLAHSLKKQNQEDEAIKVIEKFIDSYKKKDDLWSAAAQDLFAAYGNMRQYQKAADIADTVAKTQDHVAVGLMLHAQLAINKKDSDKAKSYIGQASKALTGKEPSAIKINFAETAYEAGSFEIAAQLYAETINPCLDNPLTRRYLHSLYEIRQYQKIIEIAETIRKDAGAVSEITQYEWAAYQELGNLGKAREVLTEYKKQHPKDEKAKLRLALINIRMDKAKEVHTYLKSNINLTELDLFSLIQLSNLCTISNMPFRAVEIMYFARRRFVNDADAHNAYIILLVQYDDKETKKFDVDTVQTDTAIIYDDGYFLIEDDDPKNDKFEIGTEEARERGFIGKKVGEEITIVPANKIRGSQKVKIKEIKSKYIHALHDSMQNYERRFVDRGDFMGFSAEKDSFDPLLRQLDDAKERGDHVRQLYEQNRITVDLFAKLVGKDLIEVIYALQQTPDLGIRMAKGTEDEADQGKRSTLGSSEIVIDITAIITLHDLGVKPKKIGLKKFIIGQKTRDLLTQNILRQEETRKQPQMTVYKGGDGKYIREEMTEADHRKKLKALKGLAGWVDSNTIIKPVDQSQVNALKEKAANLRQLEDIVEGSQLDAITLTLGGGRILLCDDAGLRDLAMDSFGVPGTWTQMLLQVQLEQGKLTREEYEDFVIQLANKNYHYVRIDPEILMAAAKRAEWVPRHPFDGVIKMLTRPETTIQSIVIVLANFFFEFYKQPTLIDKSCLIKYVLDSVVKYHDRNIFLPALKRAIKVRFQLAPSYSADLLNTISIWERL